MSGMECRKCGATDTLNVSLFLFPHKYPCYVAAWEKYVGPDFTAAKTARLCHVSLLKSDIPAFI